MTDKEAVKKAYEDAEKELREKQVQKVKEVITRTLEKLEVAKERKEKIEEEIKYLRMDLDDLKDGKLDRIKERQDKDPKAKEISVIIIKEKETIREVPSPWYAPYVVTWSTNYTPQYQCGGFFDSSHFVLTNSLAKSTAAGTYVLADGHIVNFR